MNQERVAPVRPRKAGEPQAVEDIVAGDSDTDLLGDIDELLDEIDKVLEDQSVLVNYRQRPGQ